MHNPESVQEKETRKILRDFEIQTGHPISARRPDLVIDNKIRESADIAVPGHHRVKLKEREKKDKCVDLAREVKNYET